MTLPLCCVRLYHADDWNINSFHTCSLMANLQRLYIKCVTRTEGHISLSETAELNLSFAIQGARLPRAKKTAAERERGEGGGC